MTRSAAEIGAGLLPARDPRPIRSGERIHVVGAAGAGASAAALLAQAAGATVTGCDAGGPSPYSVAVEAAGIPIAWAHDPAHVRTAPRPDRLAVTKALTAVAPDHPELAAAAELGIPIEPWQQVVADAAVDRTLVAVAGTHGKSTTAGWLTHVLAAAGLDPAAFVGALLPASVTRSVPATARVGRGAHFVVEADEYAGNFDAYVPDVVLLTTIEWDHPDVFADSNAVVDAFEVWLLRAPNATLVANLGDAGVDQLVRRLAARPGPVIGIQIGREGNEATPQDGIGPTPRPNPNDQSDRYIAGVASVTKSHRTELWLFDHRTDDHVGVAELELVGRHNAANAAVVAGAAIALGLEPQVVVRGLASFPGIGRRLERKGEVAGVVVYDDYAHHPTAIRATISAIRQREPGRRLWAVYEPLTFHRTAAFLDDFADVLALADGVAIADIWAGRDTDRTITSSAALADAIRQRRGDPVVAPGSVEATTEWLARQVQPGDAVLVMGGGRSYRIGELLLEALQRRTPGIASTS